MRNLNEREKNIINKILETKSNNHIQVKEFLQKFYFSEQQERALIIQTQGNYAVFFLKSEIFDDESKKNEEVQLFMELIFLIDFLNKNGYVTLFRQKTEKMYFFQELFVYPKISDNVIVLNAKGDYTSSPDTIHDKNKKVIYKGIVFKADIFELILNMTTGAMLISEKIHDLLENESSQQKIEELSNIPKNMYHHSPTSVLKYIGLSVGTISLLTLMILSFYFYSKLNKNTGQIDQLNYKNILIQKKLDEGLGILKKDIQKNADKIPGVKDPPRFFYGVDISKWNGNEAEEIDPTDSISFIICRATEGINNIDAEFKKNWKTIKDKGCIIGTYHFFHTNEDPIKQAEHYLATINAQGKTDISPIVDIEHASLPKDKEIDIAKLHDNLLLFLNYIEKKCNRIPIIYTYNKFANKYLLNKFFSRYPLWIADYSDTPSPHLPITWKEKGYKIWQKSSNYFIHSKTSDFDVFYGDKKDLYE